MMEAEKTGPQSVDRGSNGTLSLVCKLSTTGLVVTLVFGVSFMAVSYMYMGITPPSHKVPKFQTAMLEKRPRGILVDGPYTNSSQTGGYHYKTTIS